MSKCDYGNFGHAQALSSKKPCMSRDDDAIGADQDWVHESEFDDGCRDLSDLLATVSAGVGGKYDQPLNGPVFDVFYGDWGGHVSTVPDILWLALGRVTRTLSNRNLIIWR